MSSRFRRIPRLQTYRCAAANGGNGPCVESGPRVIHSTRYRYKSHVAISDHRQRTRRRTSAAGGWTLGRGLINAQPQPNGRKLDECEVVSRKLVVAGCHTPTVFDFVEKPLD